MDAPRRGGGARRRRFQQFVPQYGPELEAGGASATRAAAQAVCGDDADGAVEARLIKMSSVNVMFPKNKKPFPQQLALMSKVLRALQCYENALLESPTGTGKTLSLLCSVLSWQKQTFQEACQNRKELEEKEEAERVRLNEEMRETNQQAAAPESSSPAETPKASKETSTSKFFASQDSATKSGESWMDDGSDFDSPSGPRSKRKLNEGDMPAAAATSPGSPPPSEFKVQVSKKANRGPVTREMVFYASRTHSQIDQVVKELKRCPAEMVKGLKMSVLASRNQYCVHPEIVKDRRFASLAKRNEECVRLISKRGPGCSFLNTNSDRTQHPMGEQVWDIEDLVQAGKRRGSCPFFAAKNAATIAGSSLVLCPYNYLIDPVIREAMDLNLRGAVVIIDEAHNVEDTSLDAASWETSTEDLEKVHGELGEGCKLNFAERAQAFEVLHEFVGSFRLWVAKVRDSDVFAKDGERAVLSGVRTLLQLEEHCGLDVNMLEKLKKAQKDLEKEDPDDTFGQFDLLGTSGLLRGFLSRMLLIFGFLLQEGNRYARDYKVVLRAVEHPREARGRRWFGGRGRGVTQNNKLTVHFWCLNPAVAFLSLAEQCRSVILTSGTLSPMHSFARELGVSFPHILEANHVVNVNKQLWAGVLSKVMPDDNSQRLVDLVGNHKKQQEPIFQDALGHALLAGARVVPHGCLVFFPSYKLLSTCVERWQTVGIWHELRRAKSVILIEEGRRGSAPEPEGERGEDTFVSKDEHFENQMREFKAAAESEDGALFMCVFRGKLSEGIDFADNAARGVFIIGIPFPSFVDLRVRLKREFQDNRRGMVADKSQVLSGSEWYSLQAFRALNQAVGRCIRHKNDHGAVIFLDARFAEDRVRGSLSKWIRGSLSFPRSVPVAVDSLTAFFKFQAAGPTIASNRPDRQLSERSVMSSASSASTAVGSHASGVVSSSRRAGLTLLPSPSRDPAQAAPSLDDLTLRKAQDIVGRIDAELIHATSQERNSVLRHVVQLLNERGL